MTESTSLSLIKSVINTQKDLVVLFKGEEPILSNEAFNNFFRVSSFEQYRESFGPFIEHFVPHPSYFHKEKIEANESWFDTVSKLSEMERIVSMMTPDFEPYAFSIALERSVEDYTIVTFSDITRDLIKRIMIENHVNIDKQSGAYDKKYFLQVAKNYEDAALVNEKLLGAIMTHVNMQTNPNFAHDEKALNDFVKHFKNCTRQDDMLIRWDGGKFLLMYLVDTEQNAQRMVNKLQALVDSESMRSLGCTLTAAVQKEKEDVNSLLNKVK